MASPQRSPRRQRPRSPIVFSTGVDPVALGLVASLNRPGGNVTGTANLAGELAPKQLQLLRQSIATAVEFGILVDPAFPPTSSIIADRRRRRARWACNSLLRKPAPIATSKRPLQVFRNRALVRSWSAIVPPTTGAWSNSWGSRPVMRYPRSSHTVSLPWPAA
jgi:hypothetical protein